MSMWEIVIGQERVVEALRRAAAAGRVAHAYLFHGPDGVGKRAVALAFAQTLQCVHGEEAPCGRCIACNKVRRLIHPDVHVLFPHPSDADTGEVAARLARLAENPYAAIDFVRRPSLADPTKTSNKQALYTVARINEELRRAMSFKPVEGRYKVVVMTDAERLRVEAANAFLKLLEEPGVQTVFILTTSRPDLLLPTIVSRCQRLRFDVLEPEAIAHALARRAGTAPEAAATLARMADGSYTRALDLAENEALLEDRTFVLAFFRHAYTRHIDRLAGLVEQAGGLGRERVKGVLGLMLSWIRDLMLYRTLGEAAPLVNVDQRPVIERFCENVPGADLEAMTALVEEAIELVERNVHLTLVLMSLALALGRAMRGRHDGRLYRPLAEPAPSKHVPDELVTGAGL
ncbi:MAG: DNA polymerase III subunit delta' [Rhodothermaceae bacterium]|nr:MAG: DNA polymerase III subunit delta' [Rhodothermaceae bacterium]